MKTKAITKSKLNLQIKLKLIPLTNSKVNKHTKIKQNIKLKHKNFDYQNKQKSEVNSSEGELKIHRELLRCYNLINAFKH